MRILAVLIVLALIFFGFPLLNHVQLPQDFAPEHIGSFIAAAFDYWKSVVSSIGH